MTATGAEYGDSGGASRFFPVFRYEAKAPTKERPKVDGAAAHPTVKPVDLMRWLVRLVTPPGGLVVDPFAGSGTTGEACRAEGLRCVLIERDASYLPLIVARLTTRPGPARSAVRSTPGVAAAQPSLFDDGGTP
jgi:site-specific DNA-methyltransferase (adenine-specific)